jgi:flavin reductase (DIM6/NTAB) family NADH-FMN oxidoreductase RutF
MRHQHPHRGHRGQGHRLRQYLGAPLIFEALMATRQCVINIPTADIADKVIGCGNTSGRRVDKFRRFGLTPLPAKTVAAPLIAECYASLECRVADTRLVNRYNFFVLEVQQAWSMSLAAVSCRLATEPSIPPARTRARCTTAAVANFMIAGETVKAGVESQIAAVSPTPTFCGCPRAQPGRLSRRDCRAQASAAA